MDIADISSTKEDSILQKVLADVRTKSKGRELMPNGYCYNCGEKIKQGLFCDHDCRDDYEHRISQLKRMGKIKAN